MDFIKTNWKGILISLLIAVPSWFLGKLFPIVGRPVIATKRIDKYDGENVTFHYNRHEDEKLIVETIPALEFMERLVQHIPEKNFKMIRYYGIYARHRESDKLLYRAISKQKHKILNEAPFLKFLFCLYHKYQPNS